MITHQLTEKLRFEDHLVPRQNPKMIDAVAKLEHLAIITYAVDPDRFRGIIPDRFRLHTVPVDGKPKALLSVVPFVDTDFRLAAFPFYKATMGQTNYRIYVQDAQTGENVVWFLGTVLDSPAIVVPRNVWKLPWYRGKVRFQCDFDPESRLYRSYQVKIESDWAPARLAIAQGEDALGEFKLAGFPDLETALVLLTHPLVGYYHRRDGKLGSYRVWHDRMEVRPGRLDSAYFGLLDRLQLVTPPEQLRPHSVLLTPATEFVIYLPPRVVE